MWERILAAADVHPGAPGLSADFGGERPRFEQLTDWLGPDFDGVIAFAEAHLTKNAAVRPQPRIVEVLLANGISTAL